MSASVFRPSLLALGLLLIGSPVMAQEPAYGGAGMGVNFETRLSSIEDQMRAMNGKVEQVDYAVRRMDQALQRLQTDYEARLAKLETAPPPPPPQPAPQPAPKAETHEEDGEPEEAAEPNGTLGALKMQGDKVTSAVKNPKAPPLPNKPADYGLTPQEQYDRAFSLLRQASYDEAEKAFKSFIDKNPQDKLMNNAKYWYAETFYVRAKFSDAAVAFADAFQHNPQGAKAPDSLLKMGLALAALDQHQDACSTLNSLKSKYPNAPATIRSRADQERTRLKCGKKDKP